MIRPLKRGIVILLAALVLALGLTAPIMAAPVLTNGDFEDNPPSGFGNHFTNVGAPWIYGTGQGPNVVQVDGPGGGNYGQNGPESDASAPGAGVAQHYLDIRDGDNDFYQLFTPRCTGEVIYGASFSTRGNEAGVAGITILLDSDGSIIGPRQQTSLTSGNSKTDPWVQVSYSTVLTEGTAYRFLVGMDNPMNMDNAFVEFTTDCPDQTSITKFCAPASLNTDGSVAISCDITVTAEGPGLVTISDIMTLGSAPIAGASVAVSSVDPWVCDVSQFPTPPLCTIDTALFSGSSGITVVLTLPAGTTGTAENCATMALDEPMTKSEDIPADCVDIELPEPKEKPQLCTAFVPEISCDAGTPVVTLTNTLAGQFDPTEVLITSQTTGVTLLQSSPNALVYGLQGAKAGQTITLWAEAMAKGSMAGLDKCCMGEISLQVPEDFICEKPVVLDIAKSCEKIDGPVLKQQCRIDVHYEGPPPSPPLTVTDTLTGIGASMSSTPISSDNWACSGTATCSIDAGSDPAIDWGNFNSSLLFEVTYRSEFENCAKAVASGTEAEACTASALPALTLTKTANQPQCAVGQNCDFTITVSNPSALDFNGPITLTDAISVASGQFTAISPALCPPAQLANGQCTGNANIGAGESQSYVVTWVPPLGQIPTAYSATNCAGVTFAGGQAGALNGETDAAFCASVTVAPPVVSINKTGPAQCDLGAICSYEITLSSTAPYAGPILIYDTPPTGYSVVAVTPDSCATALPAQNFVCATALNLPSNGSQTYQISIQAAEAVQAGNNCAGLIAVAQDAVLGDYSNGPPEALQTLLAQGTKLDEVCVFVPESVAEVPPPAKIGPDLRVAKTSLGPCVTNSQGRTCDFKFAVSNAGMDAYQGPIVLNDAFKGPVSDVTFTGTGLDCRRAGDGVICLIGDGNLAVGGELSVTMQTTHTDGAASRFENCLSLGAGAAPLAQTIVVQSALKLLGQYGGAIDGQVGPQTRAAVSELQALLGAPQTGQIDQTLLDGLGVPSGGAAACVTVDLPPLPKPQCDRATTVARDGACLCKFKNMYQRDDTSCGCVRGTKFAPGQGCLKTREISTPKGPNCDPATTVAQNGQCVCIRQDFAQSSPTTCAPRDMVPRDCAVGQTFIKGLGCVEDRIFFGDGSSDAPKDDKPPGP